MRCRLFVRVFKSVQEALVLICKERKNRIKLPVLSDQIKVLLLDVIQWKRCILVEVARQYDQIIFFVEVAWVIEDFLLDSLSDFFDLLVSGDICLHVHVH